MELPGLSAAKCACQTCLVNKTVRNLPCVEAFWLLPKSLGETATSGQKASSFIIWRENMCRQRRSGFLWSNHVFPARAFALVKTRSPLMIWSPTTYFRNSSNQSNWFFWYAAHPEIVQPVTSQTWASYTPTQVAQGALHAVHLSNTTEVQ